ncbi:heme biosynthesis protein HemY [Shinella daejeonensis]|uniref:heme biosynthesis protein HemY n=1 Tax=Shinella daejeonensis TaxID=659017 RepID=UPI0020C78B9A|nr:heme biosynthesis protein HemY [Shinella daejeonensis]MCP8895946.1 heme biosynthesis protein HemY [Shinella daejeonensis]
MIRILAFILLVLALAGGFAWLADRPGELSIVWQGQRADMSLMVAATMVAALVAAIMLCWWILRVIWTSPHTIQRYFRARKRDRGYQALSTGLIAAGSGDAAAARRMHARTRGLLSADQEPLIHLLEAQAAMIEGRHDEARTLFERMAEDPETRELGLRGLYLEARRLGANEAARQYAERAAENAPQLPWAAMATLEYRSQAGQWDEALKLLGDGRSGSPEDRKTYARRKAVLLTARAAERLEADPKGAREDAQQALKLVDDFVPAGLVAARAWLREDNLRKAAAILERLFRATAHPEVARLYVRARSGDSAADRLKRAGKLEAMRPNNPEALYTLAEAALEARDFPLARAKAEASARLSPRESAFLLLADIEDAETGDQGRIRHWMNQALKAPRDPAWTADGITSPEWRAVSPVTGRLDAFEWKTPVSRIDGPIEDAAATVADEAIRTLPPVATETKPAREIPEPAVEAVAERPPVVVAAVKPPIAVKPAAAPKPAPDGGPRPAENPDETPPFYGLPDDPGVKQGAKREEAGSFRLF